MYGRQEPSQGICRFSWHYQIPVLKETELAQNTAYRYDDDPTYIPGALVLNKICDLSRQRRAAGDLLAFVPDNKLKGVAS